MTSHVHMIIGSGYNKPENIMRDMKRHTSEKLKEQIISHPTESRRECLSRLLREILAMMKKAGKENCHNREFPLSATR